MFSRLPHAPNFRLVLPPAKLPSLAEFPNPYFVYFVASLAQVHVGSQKRLVVKSKIIGFIQFAAKECQASQKLRLAQA